MNPQYEIELTEAEARRFNREDDRQPIAQNILDERGIKGFALCVEVKVRSYGSTYYLTFMQ